MNILVLAPTLVAMIVVYYGFVAITIWISLTRSAAVPNFTIVGGYQYAKLFNNDRWHVAYTNLFIFGPLLIGCSLLIGLVLAVLIDRDVRGETLFRTIFLYPYALSQIVTGLAWQWILNPAYGIEKLVHDLGFASFKFDWLINSNRAIYTLVIAGTWQATGLVMALFLAGLRGIDGELWKAARVDGIPLFQIYLRIILPMLRPVFLTAIVLLSLSVIRCFDLVVALTQGGPGFASDLPSRFMFDYTFRRDQLGMGAASAVVMMTTVLVIVIPYLYTEVKHKA
ncbi:MAG: sugar ABC transporter permease [Azospirillaceae bacterium]|nr:sugar ABC transporter permease [Azospirillaceae bacterium]